MTKLQDAGVLDTRESCCKSMHCSSEGCKIFSALLSYGPFRGRQQTAEEEGELASDESVDSMQCLKVWGYFGTRPVHLLCAGTDIIARQLGGEPECIITVGAFPNARHSRMYIDVVTSGGTL